MIEITIKRHSFGWTAQFANHPNPHWPKEPMPLSFTADATEAMVSADLARRFPDAVIIGEPRLDYVNCRGE